MLSAKDQDFFPLKQIYSSLAPTLTMFVWVYFLDSLFFFYQPQTLLITVVLY